MNAIGTKLTLSGTLAIIGVIFIVISSLGALFIHSANYATSKDPIYKEAMINDVKNLATGQYDIVVGLDGLQEINDNPEIYQGNIRVGLIDYFKQKVILGIVFTLFYIYLVAKGFGWLFGKATSGIDTPWLIKWGLAIIVVGGLSLVVQWPSWPFHGFIQLAQNYGLMSLT